MHTRAIAMTMPSSRPASLIDARQNPPYPDTIRQLLWLFRDHGFTAYVVGTTASGDYVIRVGESDWSRPVVVDPHATVGQVALVAIDPIADDDAIDLCQPLNIVSSGPLTKLFDRGPEYVRAHLEAGRYPNRHLSNGPTVH